MHQIRRYTSPDEHAFFPESLSPCLLPQLRYEEVLHPAGNDINVNAEVMRLYLQNLMPAIVKVSVRHSVLKSRGCGLLTLRLLSYSREMTSTMVAA